MKNILDDRVFLLKLAGTLLVLVASLALTYWRYNACMELEGATTWYCLIDAGS